MAASSSSSVNVERISAMVQAKVSLKTDDGVFTGVVLKYSDKHAVVLNQVTCANDKNELPVPLSGVITIRAEEILDCECLSLPRPSPPSTNTTRVTDASPLSEIIKSLNRQKPSTPTPPDERATTDSRTATEPPTSHLTNGVCETESRTSLLQSMSIPFDDLSVNDVEYNDKRPSRYVVVEKLGEMFHEAIALIKSQVMIGVGFDGIEMGRHGQVCWIQISTKEVVVLFDMCSVNQLDDAFDNGFREIFESPKILKILHDCRQVSDFLKHQFDTRLTNVYDTQVADIMVFRYKSKGMMPNQVRSLDAVLTEFLKLSRAEVAFYHIRRSSLEKDPEVWRRRPQSPMFCQLAAVNVRYLRELRLATLEALMRDFTEGVDIYLDTRDADHVSDITIDGDTKLPRDFLKFGPVVGTHRSSSSNKNGLDGLTMSEVVENVRLRPLNVGAQYVKNGQIRPVSSDLSIKRSDGERHRRNDRIVPTTTPDESSTSKENFQQQKDGPRVMLFPAGINLQELREDGHHTRNNQRRPPSHRNGH